MAMPTQYDINAFIKGVNGFGLPFSTQKFSATLDASSDTTLAVPTIAAIGAINSTNESIYLALFSYKNAANVYVALNATAAVPAGATFAATTSELNPNARVVKSGDTIHMFSAAAADVTVSFYTLQVG